MARLKRRESWLFGGLIVALLAFGAHGLRAGTTPEAEGCEGLAAYERAMLAAGEAWAESMRQEGMFGRDPLTYSPDDWLAAGEYAANVQEAIKEITPPPFAADWHQVQIESFGAYSSLARTVGTSGLIAALVFDDVMDELDERRGTAREAAVTACPAFADFVLRWDLLDGELDRDATPAATPEEGVHA